ncbi:MAG TPA: carboxypeptidase regulatory-like domain-containing protein [Thermoanaerobaculia bacterium]|nr:carboxypeptidase regulatory-like domain-containing protein [Thermoanaerobaculia bacterium]
MWGRALVLLLIPCGLFAQATTGNIVGTVISGGKVLPGATVSVTSQSLQGTRTATSGEAGGYYFPSLPPGEYTVVFELSGLQSVRKRVTVDVATTSHADVEMKVAAVSEAMTVTAGAAPAAESTQVTTNFKMATINALPLDRTINAITLLSPGVTEAGPTNQITISGSYSFDSLFLVDGVIVNENLRGQPNPLYIEDAIQETTVLTGGVSAEFGRFTGGVVSTITKSGGNEFSGSLRDNITNPSWAHKTDLAAQADPPNEIRHQFEGTYGGRIVRDRLWFFSAGRYQKIERGAQTTFTNIRYVVPDKERRYEGKMTAQVAPKHSVIASYIDERDQASNTVAGAGNRVMDLRSVVPFDRPREDVPSLVEK